MSWKRKHPLLFWLLAYPVAGVSGAIGLCACALVLMQQDGDFGGPAGLAVVLLATACVGALGGVVICALTQLGFWLHETLTSDSKRRP